jgi:hypothetical protein
MAVAPDGHWRWTCLAAALRSSRAGRDIRREHTARCECDRAAAPGARVALREVGSSRGIPGTSDNYDSPEIPTPSAFGFRVDPAQVCRQLGVAAQTTIEPKTALGVR